MEEMTPIQSIEKESAEHPLMGIMKSFSEPDAGDEALIIQQFPETITKQMSLLADLEKKKNDAWEKADKAKEAAEQMKGFVIKKILGHEYKSGDKAEIIADTQDVVRLVADSEKDLADAMKTSFDFQEALSKSTEWLFAVGCLNIAANEAMIDQIISIRDNKSSLGKFQLTEDVKKRILDVAKRLKAHQDILRRQISHEERVKRQFADWKVDYDKTLTKKQDSISDLDTIRTNAQKGATAVQPETLKSYVKTDDSRLTDARPASDVPTWAKKKQKPSYTAKEIGALPKDTKISEIDGFSEEHQRLESKQDVIADLDSIRSGAALGANLNQEVTTLQQTLQKAQEDLQKEHQGYEKLKRALVTTSIGIGTISVGALIALLILIL